MFAKEHHVFEYLTKERDHIETLNSNGLYLNYLSYFARLLDDYIIFKT